MSTLGMVHTTFGCAALVLGLGVVTLRKGTHLHRTVGHLYFSSMLALNVTALLIYRLFGHFGPFHALAIISLIYLLWGISAVVLRRPRDRWLHRHTRFMLWSYVGLIAAAICEITARVPGWNFALAVIVPSLLVCAIGWVLIETKGKETINRMSRREGVAEQFTKAGQTTARF